MIDFCLGGIIINMKTVFRYCCGVIGALLVFFFGFKCHMDIAPWLALPLLIMFFRSRKSWKETVPIVLILLLSRLASLYGGWHVSFGMLIVFSLLASMPTLAALYLDRFFYKKLRVGFSLLLFPCVYTLIDYLITYLGLGMTLSLSSSQYSFQILTQISSLMGSYVMGFSVALFAPFAVLFFENISNLKKATKPILSLAVCFMMILSFGSVRMALSKPENQTVRIASITVEHPEDYYTTIVDQNTPRDDAAKKKPGMNNIIEELFRLSERAADYGAEIIFWSEINAPMYEEDYSAFLERAKDFARSNSVWFMPTPVVFRYDTGKADNLAVIINQHGEVEYRYEKSISWYPTDSDGILPLVETPYGTISTALCFDLDHPNLIHQAQQVDIMLVPSYDKKEIDDFHSRLACLRAVENGFSMVRQSNEGSAIAVDYLGNTLGYQNFFNTTPRIMISDVPQKGVRTLYGLTGEVFLWLIIAFIPLMFMIELARYKRESHKGA
jgi:apolipoprotein N-acyltransferase